MSPKRYFLWVVATSIASITSTWILVWWLQPLYGELTRIGGFSERNYGWNTPIDEFHPLLATWGNTYDHGADVLVVGDSFANGRPPMQWQNLLAASTGWRIHTVDKNVADLDGLISSSTFRISPPRIVVWNNVERDLKDEYAAHDDRCTSGASSFRLTPLKQIPTHARPVSVSRAIGFAELNPGFARIWLWKNILREAGLYESDALSFQLRRSDLFSSRASDRLLVYRRDFRKLTWKDADLVRIRCGYANLASRFEANGTTRFVTAIAPDKSSAYRPWLTYPGALPASRLADLLGHFPVDDARLDLVIANAIAAGTRDVYLPDDTHWGSAGHKLAAEAILRLLIKDGLAQ